MNNKVITPLGNGMTSVPLMGLEGRALDWAILRWMGWMLVPGPESEDQLRFPIEHLPGTPMAKRLSPIWTPPDQERVVVRIGVGRETWWVSPSQDGTIWSELIRMYRIQVVSTTDGRWGAIYNNKQYGKAEDIGTAICRCLLNDKNRRFIVVPKSLVENKNV